MGIFLCGSPSTAQCTCFGFSSTFFLPLPLLFFLGGLFRCAFSFVFWDSSSGSWALLDFGSFFAGAFGVAGVPFGCAVMRATSKWVPRGGRWGREGSSSSSLIPVPSSLASLSSSSSPAASPSSTSSHDSSSSPPEFSILSLSWIHVHSRSGGICRTCRTCRTDRGNPRGEDRGNYTKRAKRPERVKRTACDRRQLQRQRKGERIEHAEHIQHLFVF